MARRLSGLLTRGLSALLLAAISLVVTAQGGFAFLILLFVFSALVHWEWHKTSGTAGMLALLPALIASFVATWLVHNGDIQNGLYVLVLAVAFGVFAAMLAKGAAVWSGIGVLYVALPAMAFVLLRQDSFEIVAWLFMVVWLTDIGAYLVGSIVGGPKLWVRVSPGKTWSGAVGGSVLGTLAGLLLGPEWLGADYDTGSIVLLAFALTIVGQLGDLAESAWKRHFNVKDSGRIIPGHGGVMDRVDSLLAGGIFLVGVRTFSGAGM